MPEYAYSSAKESWGDAYLWPTVLRELQRWAPAPSRIFELGCGNGGTARSLEQHGYSVVGVDPSQSGIALAGQFASANLRFEVGSTAEDLAERFGRFRAVISLEVIEHCASPREFMRVFASLIEPGGVGILSTPYHGYLKNLALAVSGRFDRHFDPLWETGHLRFFSIDKLRSLFEEFGFTHHEFHRVGRIPPLAKSVVAVIRRDRG